MHHLQQKSFFDWFPLAKQKSVIKIEKQLNPVGIYQFPTLRKPMLEVWFASLIYVGQPKFIWDYKIWNIGLAKVIDREWNY